jgi:N-acetylmuramoyl-L-alanine amidase
VRSVRTGDSGPEVRDIQQRLVDLGFRIDPAEARSGFEGSTQAAVRAFQDSRNLHVDGLVGPDTWGQLVEAGYRLGDRTLYLHSPVYRGDDVRALQRKLNGLGFDAGREDGMFGPDTARAVREFQRNVGDAPDGMVGFATVRTLQRMRPSEEGPGRALVREGEELRQRRGSLEGSIIAIDAGTADTGGDANHRLAVALRDSLARLGAKPEILTEVGVDRSTSELARLANELGAVLCLSLRLGDGVPEGAGPTCSYFGSPRTHSPAGQLLAGYILDELEGKLGQRGRLQRLTAAMLRETLMPAVQIEPVACADPREAVRLEDPAFVTLVADAIAAGSSRYFTQSSGGVAGAAEH